MERKITANTIAPGAIATEFAGGSNKDPEKAAIISNITALGRVGEAEDVGGTVAFLCSEKATIYGVSFCAVHLFENILNNEKINVPVSTHIPEYIRNVLNTKGIFLSLYSEISAAGATSYTSYIPNPTEVENLQKSVDIIAPLIPAKYL